MTGGKLFAFYYEPMCRIMMHCLLKYIFWWTLTSDKNIPLRYLFHAWPCPQRLALGLMCCCVWVHCVLLSLNALTPMSGPSELNHCVTCSVACPLSAETLECYLCRGPLCRACLFRGACLCADCVQHMNPLLARVPTMDIFYNDMSEEPLQRTRWVVELADALTECHICRSIGFFVPCSSCSKPTCVGCQQSPSEQCDQQCSMCCMEDWWLQFVKY